MSARRSSIASCRTRANASSSAAPFSRGCSRRTRTWSRSSSEDSLGPWWVGVLSDTREREMVPTNHGIVSARDFAYSVRECLGVSHRLKRGGIGERSSCTYPQPARTASRMNHDSGAQAPNSALCERPPCGYLLGTSSFFHDGFSSKSTRASSSGALHSRVCPARAPHKRGILARLALPWPRSTCQARPWPVHPLSCSRWGDCGTLI